MPPPDPLNPDPCDELARDVVACARLLAPAIAAAALVIVLLLAAWLLPG